MNKGDRIPGQQRGWAWYFLLLFYFYLFIYIFITIPSGLQNQCHALPRAVAQGDLPWGATTLQHHQVGEDISNTWTLEVHTPPYPNPRRTDSMKTQASSVTHAGDTGLGKYGLQEGSSLTFELQLCPQLTLWPHRGILLSSEYLPLSEIIDVTFYFLLLLRSGAQESPGAIGLGGSKACPPSVLVAGWPTPLQSRLGKVVWHLHSLGTFWVK